MTLSVALRHAFGGFTLDAAFEAPRGITVLFGRSGSGKTTIVNAVAGLLRPDHGRIAVDGRVLLDTARGVFLPPSRRRVGYVFQEGRLFPHLTVRQNLGYGRWFAPKDGAPRGHGPRGGDAGDRPSPRPPPRGRFRGARRAAWRWGARFWPRRR